MPAPLPNGRPDQAAHFVRLIMSQIPESVAKSIGSDEYNDRIAEAARLSAQASDPALSADLRAAARLKVRKVLEAQPRDVTRRQHRELIAKAAAAKPEQAGRLRRQAEQLIEERHPVAPPRTAARVAKAASDEPIPVFDSQGNLLGICKPSALTPLAGATQVSPSDDSSQTLVAKAVEAAGFSIVYDSGFRPHLARARNVEWPGRVAKETADEVNARFQRKASGKMLAGDDDGDDKGYGPGAASPEEQARRGSVRAGGTTGLGPKRKDPKQRALPGDVPDRVVVKAAGPFKTVGEANWERRLTRIWKATGRDLSKPHAYARNPHSSAGSCVCGAPAGYRTHTGAAPGVPVLASVRKAAAWWTPKSGDLTAVDQWLAAQRRRSR